MERPHADGGDLHARVLKPAARSAHDRESDGGTGRVGHGPVAGVGGVRVGAEHLLATGNTKRQTPTKKARSLRHSGEPRGSQRTAAGAVGNWSAASVVRRACINTVHDLRSAAPLGIGAGHGRTTGGRGGQQKIEIDSRSGEGKHSCRRHVRTRSRRLSPLRRQGRLSDNAVRPRAGSGTTTSTCQGRSPGSAHDTGPDGRYAARSWAGRSTSGNASPSPLPGPGASLGDHLRSAPSDERRAGARQDGRPGPGYRAS